MMIKANEVDLKTLLEQYLRSDGHVLNSLWNCLVNGDSQLPESRVADVEYPRLSPRLCLEGESPQSWEWQQGSHSDALVDTAIYVHAGDLGLREWIDLENAKERVRTSTMGEQEQEAKLYEAEQKCAQAKAALAKDISTELTKDLALIPEFYKRCGYLTIVPNVKVFNSAVDRIVKGLADAGDADLSVLNEYSVYQAAKNYFNGKIPEDYLALFQNVQHRKPQVLHSSYASSSRLLSLNQFQYGQLSFNPTLSGATHGLTKSATKKLRHVEHPLTQTPKSGRLTRPQNSSDLWPKSDDSQSLLDDPNSDAVSYTKKGNPPLLPNLQMMTLRMEAPAGVKEFAELPKESSAPP